MGNFINVTKKILSLSDNDYIVKSDSESIWVTKQGKTVVCYRDFHNFARNITFDIKKYEDNIDFCKRNNINLGEDNLRDMSSDLIDVANLREDGYSVKQSKAGQVYIGQEDCLILYYSTYDEFTNCVNKDMEEYEKIRNIQYKLATNRPCSKWPRENLYTRLKNRPNIRVETVLVAWTIVMSVIIAVIVT